MVDSQRVERTLALTRAQFHAQPGARERVRAKLVARGDLGQGPPSVSPLAGRAAGITKRTAALLVGLSFSAGLWLGGQRSSERGPQAPLAGTAIEAPAPVDALAPAEARAAAEPRATVAAPAPEAGATIARTPLAAAAPRAERSRAGRRGARTARARAEAERAFSDEIALLQRAERAIRSAEPDLALSLLDEIDRRYPQTRLVEERTAARLLARCARAEPGAQAQAELFLRDRSRSVYSDRVRELCRLEAASRARDGNPSAGH